MLKSKGAKIIPAGLRIRINRRMIQKNTGTSMWRYRYFKI